MNNKTRWEAERPRFREPGLEMRERSRLGGQRQGCVGQEKRGRENEVLANEKSGERMLQAEDSECAKAWKRKRSARGSAWLRGKEKM